MAKLMPKSFIQNLVVCFQNARPVRTYIVSIKAMTTPSPIVSGTNSQ